MPTIRQLIGKKKAKEVRKKFPPLAKKKRVWDGRKQTVEPKYISKEDMQEVKLAIQKSIAEAEDTSDGC